MSHPSIETLDPQEIKDLLDHGKLLLIDVREPAEFAVERIHGAVLYPLSTFDAFALPHDWTRRVVFYCGSGKRSLAAAESVSRRETTRRPIWAAASRPGSAPDSQSFP